MKTFLNVSFLSLAATLACSQPRSTVVDAAGADAGLRDTFVDSGARDVASYVDADAEPLDSFVNKDFGVGDLGIADAVDVGIEDVGADGGLDVGSPTPPPAPQTAPLFLIVGQSNGSGTMGLPIQTTEEMADFNGCQPGARNAIERIHNDYGSNCLSDREFPHAGLIHQVRSRINHPAALVAIPCAVPGSGIASWSPEGGVNYDRCLPLITRAVNEVSSNPSLYSSDGTTEVVSVHVWHGEANQAMSATEYRERFEALMAGLNTDVKKITGQSRDLSFFLEVPTTHAARVNQPTPPGVVEAQLALCADNDKVHCVGTNVYFSGSDSLHKDGPGHRLAGEQMGYAVWREIWADGWTDFSVYRAVTSGTEATLCWDVPTGPIVVQNEVESVPLGQGGPAPYGCPANPRYLAGIEIADSAGEVAISNLVLVDDNCLRVTLDRPLGVGSEYRIGWTAAPISGALSCQVSTGNPFTNVADSSNAPGRFYALPERGSF